MFRVLSVVSMVGLVDAISYMAVAPSLIFYVRQAGGDKEHYGVALSVFSFASFCAKPVYGVWVDRNGNQYRVPFLASLAVSTLGALLYFFASCCDSTNIALGMILVGRMLGGIGAANQALGFAYVAEVIPIEQQTRANSIFGAFRLIGMAAGPAVNVLLDQIDSTTSIGGVAIHLDAWNSVGLLLAAGNLVVAVAVFAFLKEPTDQKTSNDNPSSTAFKDNILHSIISFDILLPLLTLVVTRAAFVMVETAFPPAAADALGWGPVESSAVLGGSSILIFAAMMSTVYLSSKASDRTMVAMGTSCWLVGSLGTWWFWKRNETVVQWVLPVAIGAVGLPFVISANRTSYTRAVKCKPALENSSALMQSFLSMAASMAGFITPGLVAAYFVRSPQEVSDSNDLGEMTPIALSMPILHLFVLAGLVFESTLEDRGGVSESDTEASERRTLLPKDGQQRSTA